MPEGRLMPDSDRIPYYPEEDDDGPGFLDPLGGTRRGRQTTRRLAVGVASIALGALALSLGFLPLFGIPWCPGDHSGLASSGACAFTGVVGAWVANRRGGVLPIAGTVVNA